MTLSEAMKQFGPEWLSIWLPILLVSMFVLPLALLVWKSTRLTAVICIVSSAIGGFGVNFLYGKLGYVKLLGLPHIVVWTPLVIYLMLKIKSSAVEKGARILMTLILVILSISLVFDYFDAIRYLLGDRAPAT